MPTRIGRYAVRRRIGSGAFATVWLAYDEELDSPVAVKVLAENWTEDGHVRRRFQEEGRFLRKVESPHVVAVYDAGELDDGRPYLVMSYADQGTLVDRLEVEGLTTGQAFEVVRQVGLGLTALHEQGVLHRDVKPANVLFRSVDTREGGGGQQIRAMLADLGLGKALDLSSRLTMIAGTPSFVAPEQAQGEQLDGRADLYSLAALTFLLLSGQAPFTHASLSAAADPGPAPELSQPDRPFRPEVEAVVRRGLEPDRDLRWPDVAAFVSALGAALQPQLAAESDGTATGLPGPWLPLDPNLTQPGPRPTSLPDEEPLTPPTPPARLRPTRARVLALALVGVLVVVTGAAAGYALRQGQDRTVEVADVTGSLRVTVPETWSGATLAGQWEPPGQSLVLPALSVGSDPDWHHGEAGAEGVFVGVLAAEDLPEQLPGHEECETVLAPVTDTLGQDPLLTQVSLGCPGVIVERVRQVASNRSLWIQVRSDSRSRAYEVLGSVEVPGF
jgi:eukaryotic-like serine/threonine-protein kinase